MKNQISNYIRAGYSGLYILSHEEQRVEAEFKSVVADLNQGVKKDERFRLYVWSITEGIANAENGETIADTENPLAPLDRVISGEMQERSIILLRDYHLVLADVNPVVYRKFKDALIAGKTSNRVLAVIGCQLKLPPELEKEMTVIEYQLPDREQLRVILESVAEENGVHLNGTTEKSLDAAGGLTTLEAENAFALSIIETKALSPDVISREKSNTVKKNGLLEIIERHTPLEEIGGLENLKADLVSKRNLFTKAAREYGLPTPRGQLYVGQAGTGKSLCATATGSIFNLPIVRLEAGRIFGGTVGESERNWRTAFSTVRAVAPCVFWVDEVDGLFSGAESSGHTDGGTTARVIKAILQDMQFNGEGIFFVFTANDIDGLPDPLIDRLDVWSVDLPTASEREAIWSIHITKRGRKPGKFDLGELARLTDGYSGRQIEQVWLKSMTVAFNANREPQEKDVMEVCKMTVPTSLTMAEAIKRRRERLKDRATPASKVEEVKSTGRKLAVSK